MLFLAWPTMIAREKKWEGENPLGERQQSDHPSLHFSFYLTLCQLVYIAQTDRHTSSMLPACDLSHVYTQKKRNTHWSTNPFLITFISITITSWLLSKSFFLKEIMGREHRLVFIFALQYIYWRVVRDCVLAYRHIITLFFASAVCFFFFTDWTNANGRKSKKMTCCLTIVLLFFLFF